MDRDSNAGGVMAPHNHEGGPVVLARPEHGVSRKQVSSAALRVLYGLKEAGFHACLVGGAVRDLLLGGEPKDFDVATDARPEQIRQVFRNCRLIGRRFVIAHVRFGGEIIEVTTFRGSGGGAEDEEQEREVSDGLILRDNVFGSIEEDARRRDFTVNALYYDIADYSVRDYVGGLRDLELRQLRLIGNPVERYREDPVRMLRAARLAAKLGMSIEARTEAPIRAMAELLDGIPPARLFDDLQKLFLYGHALASYQQLLRLGLWDHLFPSAPTDPDSGKPSADALIRAALASTDQRVAEDRPVTPAFLFAAFLWEPLLHEIGEADAQRDEVVADAAEEVFRQAGARVALPRRFSIVTREIWELQWRLPASSPGRARRLMRHPRFRAAFDFLQLRAAIDPDLADLAQRWEQAQVCDGAEFDALFKPGSLRVDAAAADPAPARRKRRRRRRPAAVPAEVE